MLNEINQTEKDKYSMISRMCGITRKQMNAYNKAETYSLIQKTNKQTDIENKLTRKERAVGEGAR